MMLLMLACSGPLRLHKSTNTFRDIYTQCFASQAATNMATSLCKTDDSSISSPGLSAGATGIPYDAGKSWPTHAIPAFENRYTFRPKPLALKRILQRFQ